MSLYRWVYRQLCWVSLEEACSKNWHVQWWRRLARRVLPEPKPLSSSDQSHSQE